jgi:hypothetical protein
MRTPEIFERFLLRYGVEQGNEAAIIQGAASTTMSVDITPGSSVVEGYLRHVPAKRAPGCTTFGNAWCAVRWTMPFTFINLRCFAIG